MVCVVELYKHIYSHVFQTNGHFVLKAGRVCEGVVLELSRVHNRNITWFMFETVQFVYFVAYDLTSYIYIYIILVSSTRL